MYGDGMQRREWLHVSDHCRAIELVLRHGRIGEVYNIGGVNERPNLEVLHLLLEIMGKPRSLLCHVEDRPGHDRRYAIDSTKIRTELGWQPQVNFEDGLRSTVQWYLDHRDWWERILSGEFRAYYEKMYGSRKRLNPQGLTSAALSVIRKTSSFEFAAEPARTFRRRGMA